MKQSHPLPAHDALTPLTHAARFVDGLRAWWWPGAGRKAPAVAGEERNAVHRWEDEGGNVS